MRNFSFSCLLARHKLKDVFTPSTVARLTYVERKHIESDLIRNLGIPGLQIVLYGHSGSGKSTLIMNKLQELKINKIKTNCTESTTFDQLVLSAFDKLGTFYKTERSRSDSVSINSSIKDKYLQIESSISSTLTQSDSERSQRVVPIQLTAERLSEFLGAANCVWIIEDFHKVPSAEKTKLSQVLKVFMDTATDYPNVKIVCIGAVGTGRELIEYDRELSNRVTESYVPLMSNDELREIVAKGFRLMNIGTYEIDLIDKIVYYSNNLASVCHQLCFDICHSKGITRSAFFSKKISLADFGEAVNRYIRKVSDTFASYYEKICGRSDLKEILVQLVNSEKELFSGADIQRSKKMQSKEEIDAKLFELTSAVEYGEILRFNQHSKVFAFSNPFFHAYLKMKFATERSEKQARRHGQMELYDIAIPDFKINDYIEIMNKIMESKIKFVAEQNIEIKTYKGSSKRGGHSGKSDK